MRLSWVGIFAILVAEGCSLEQRISPRIFGCTLTGCEDSGVVAKGSTVVPPPPPGLVVVDDAGNLDLPECRGECDPEDEDAIECVVAKNRTDGVSPEPTADGLSFLVLTGSEEPGFTAPTLTSENTSLTSGALSSMANGSTSGSTPTASGSAEAVASGFPSGDALDASLGVDAAANGLISDASSTRESDAAVLQPVASGSGEGEVGGTFAEQVACRVGVSSAGRVQSVCSIAGRGQERAPCTTSNDCSRGLGCVESEGGGQCLKYCCTEGSCGADCYCARRPLQGTHDPSKSYLVPVCSPAENCQLGEPYPCQAGEACSCTPGNACTIVDDMGTRACVAPGEGHEGDTCPCAAGYVCSAARRSCLQLCRLNDASSCRDDKTQCQPGPSGYPQGWGLCVPKF